MRSEDAQIVQGHSRWLRRHSHIRETELARSCVPVSHPVPVVEMPNYPLLVFSEVWSSGI